MILYLHKKDEKIEKRNVKKKLTHNLHTKNKTMKTKKRKIKEK